MTREAQIRQTAAEWLRYNHPTCTQDMLVEAFRCGAEWADKHQPTPWISVEERMPEKVNKFLSDEVLVRYLRGGKEYTFVTHYDYEYQTWNIPNVTHWMPIPELFLPAER